MHKVLFTNSIFNENAGGGHGAAIYFNLDIAQYKCVNKISACTFSKNRGYKA